MKLSAISRWWYWLRYKVAYLLRPGHWLSYQARQRIPSAAIRKELLARTAWQTSFLRFLKSPRSIFLIGSILVLWGLIIFWLHPFSGMMSLDEKAVSTFLESRISNLVDLLGVIFVLVTLVFIVVQIKRNDEKLMPILIRESFLFPIVTLSLGSLCLILFGAAWGTESVQVGSSFAFTSVCLILAVVASLVLMLVRVYDFFRHGFIQDLYFRRLKEYGAGYLERKWMSLESARLLKAWEEKAGFAEHALDGLRVSHLSLDLSEPRMVLDLNLNRWDEYVEGVHPDDRKEFHLDLPWLFKMADVGHPLIWSPPHRVRFFRRALDKWLVLQPWKIKPMQPFEEYENLWARLKDAIKEGDEDGVKAILDRYDGLYDAFATILGKGNALESSQIISGFQVLTFHPWEFLQPIIRHLKQGMILAIEAENKEIAGRFWGSLSHIISWAVKQRSLSLLRELRLPFLDFLGLSHGFDVDGQPFSYVAANILRDKILDLPDPGTQILSVEERESAVPIYEVLFRWYSELLKFFLDQLDQEGFQQTIDHFKNLFVFELSRNRYLSKLSYRNQNLASQAAIVDSWKEFIAKHDSLGNTTSVSAACKMLLGEEAKLELVKQEIASLERETQIECLVDDYYGRVTKTVRAWIYHGFQIGIYDADTSRAFLRLLPASGFFLWDDLNELLSHFGRGIIQSMDLDSWEMQLSEQNAFAGSRYTEWYVRGFLLTFLEDGMIPADISQAKIHPKIEHVHDLVFPEIDRLVRNLAFWRPVLLTPSPDIELQQKLNRLRDVLLRLKRKHEFEALRAIVNEPIDEEWRKQMVTAQQKQWKGARNLPMAFAEFGNLLLFKPDDPDSLERKFYSPFMVKLKLEISKGNGQMYFSLPGGREIALQEERYIVHRLRQGRNPLPIFDCYRDAIRAMITDLRDRGYAPNLILVPEEFGLSVMDFVKDSNWNPDIGSSEKRLYRVVGYYDAIPIVIFHTSDKGLAFVLDFPKTAKLYYGQNPEYFDEVFCAEARGFTSKEAKNIYDSNPDRWVQYESYSELSEEESLLLIRSSIKMQYSIAQKLEFQDVEAYRGAMIKKGP